MQKKILVNVLQSIQESNECMRPRVDGNRSNVTKENPYVMFVFKSKCCKGRFALICVSNKVCLQSCDVCAFTNVFCSFPILVNALRSYLLASTHTHMYTTHTFGSFLGSCFTNLWLCFSFFLLFCLSTNVSSYAMKCSLSCRNFIYDLRSVSNLDVFNVALVY